LNQRAELAQHTVSLGMTIRVVQLFEIVLLQTATYRATLNWMRG
jgi:hypothetical protein